MKINKTVLSIMSIIAVLIFVGCKNGVGASGGRESARSKKNDPSRSVSGGVSVAAKPELQTSRVELEIPVSASEIKNGDSVWKIGARDLDSDEDLKKVYDNLTESLKEAGISKTAAENTARILTSMELTFTANIQDSSSDRDIRVKGKNGRFNFDIVLERDKQALEGDYKGYFTVIKESSHKAVEELSAKCNIRLQIPKDIVEGTDAAQKLKVGQGLKLVFE